MRTHQFVIVLPTPLGAPLVVDHHVPDLLLLFSRLVPHDASYNQAAHYTTHTFNKKTNFFVKYGGRRSKVKHPKVNLIRRGQQYIVHTYIHNVNEAKAFKKEEGRGVA